MPNRRRRLRSAGFSPWQNGFNGQLVGTAESAPAADLWEKVLYPNFPKVTLAAIRTVAGSVITGAGFTSGTVSDVALDSSAPAQDRPYGNSEVQITQANNVTAGFIGGAAVSPVDVRNSNIVFSWRPGANNSVILSNYLVQIRIFSAGTPAAPSANFHVCTCNAAFVSKIYNAAFRTKISLPINLFTANGTGADLSAITYAQLVVRRNASSVITFGPGDIECQPNPRINDLTPMIVRFDGGYDSQYSYGYPALQAAFGANNAKALLHIPLHTIGGGGVMSQSEIDDWCAHGGKFAPHDWTTENAQANEAAYKTEWVGARVAAKALGYDHSAAIGAYYTFVDVNEQKYVWAKMRNQLSRMELNFQSASSTATPMFGGGETFPPGDQWNIRCVSANSWGVTPETYVTNWMNNARDNRGMGILTIHSELDAAGTGRTTFDTFISNIVANPDKFVLKTPDELFDPYVTQYGGIP